MKKSVLRTPRQFRGRNPGTAKFTAIKSMSMFSRLSGISREPLFGDNEFRDESNNGTSGANSTNISRLTSPGERDKKGDLSVCDMQKGLIYMVLFD